MEEVLRTIERAGSTRHTQCYEFWDQADSGLDDIRELERASEFDPELIVAKSLGTILASRGIHQGELSPKHCVFIGIPVGSLNEAARTVFDGWGDTGIDSLFIQQSHDRTGGFRQLCDLLPSAPNCTTVEVAGEDHMYTDVMEIGKIVNAWLDGLHS